MSGAGARYIQMQSEPMPSTISSFFSFRQSPESTRIFDELPKATIVFVSRPDASDISPALLTYTIEFRYKQARSFRFFIFIFPCCSLDLFFTPLFALREKEKEKSQMNNNLEFLFDFYSRLGLELLLFSDFISS